MNSTPPDKPTRPSLGLAQAVNRSAAAEKERVPSSSPASSASVAKISAIARAAAAKNSMARAASLQTPANPSAKTATTPSAKIASMRPGTRRKTGTRKAKDAMDGVKQRQRQRPETRAQMLERLTNPLISLHEAGVLLRVCAATVRHYSDSGLLPHVRTEGGQRRFYFRDVMALVRQFEVQRQQK